MSPRASSVARAPVSALAASSSWPGVMPRLTSCAALSGANSSLPCVKAEIEMSPLVERTPSSALAINAFTSFSTSLKASDRPTDSAPAPPKMPIAPASEMAPATALMPDASSAVTLMRPASMPFAPSPSIVAWTKVRMVLAPYEPAPLAPTPATRPPPTAPEAAITSASMLALVAASTVSAPVVRTPVSRNSASTCAGLGTRRCCHRLVSP